MAENSKIEWTDHTFNPWTGCTKVSPGCDHCYAEGWAKRSGAVKWGAGEPRRRTTAANWNKALKWEAGHQDFLTLHGRRQRVFCASLADVFDNAADPAWRADLFALIANTPHLDWLLLTKRIGNARAMIREAIGAPSNAPDIWLPNVWLGATIVNQEEAERDLPKLLAVPARVRFLSIEPLLGPVDLRRFTCHGAELEWSQHGQRSFCSVCGAWAGEHAAMLDWVIVGGESGPGARPMHPDWARSLRDQCCEAGVPFLFKQWGEWLPTERSGETEVVLRFEKGLGEFSPKQPQFHDWADGAGVARVGKKAAGRALDGVTHDGYPASGLR